MKKLLILCCGVLFLAAILAVPSLATSAETTPPNTEAGWFPPETTVSTTISFPNVTTAETLRAVLANPKKYAPNGVYIMRIHGTFVNFLDLSPAIQEDIILRLDPASTHL